MAFTSPSQEAVVVVGGGFGGIFTALSIHKRHPEQPLILIEPRSEFIFQPLLYELLSEEHKTWEVAPQYKYLLNGRGICWLQDKASIVDTVNKKIHTSNGTCIGWGILIIATGSRSHDFGIPGVKEHSFSFRDLNDVALLRKRIKEIRHHRQNNASLVIVGAGASGVEVACKLSDLVKNAAQLHLIEMSENILPNSTSFNRDKAFAALEQRGVKLHLNTVVKAVQSNLVELNNGRSLNHNGLIWSAGSKPSLPTINPAPKLHNGCLVITEDLRVQGEERIFAIGDAAYYKKQNWPASAQVAMQQAEAVTRAIDAIESGLVPKPFLFEDRGEMLSLGIGDACLTSMGITLSGPLAFNIRKAKYLTCLPGLSLGARSVSAWFLSL